MCIRDSDIPVWEKYTLTIEEASKYFRCLLYTSFPVRHHSGRIRPLQNGSSRQTGDDIPFYLHHVFQRRYHPPVPDNQKPGNLQLHMGPVSYTHLVPLGLLAGPGSPSFPVRACRLCRDPYRGRSRSDKHAAVLRPQNTRPKDRRVYTPLTLSLRHISLGPTGRGATSQVPSSIYSSQVATTSGSWISIAVTPE